MASRDFPGASHQILACCLEGVSDEVGLDFPPNARVAPRRTKAAMPATSVKTTPNTARFIATDKSVSMIPKSLALSPTTCTLPTALAFPRALLLPGRWSSGVRWDHRHCSMGRKRIVGRTDEPARSRAYRPWFSIMIPSRSIMIPSDP